MGNQMLNKMSAPEVGGVPEKRQRNSNLELLRIIAMLLIIAHHFVVNSGVTENYDYTGFSANVVFLQLFGMWGKTAINVFVLISGFFLCSMTLTWQRWFKIYLQSRFYRYLIFVILFIIGYETLSLTGLFKMIFGIWRGVNGGFTPSFLFFYLLVPFYNLLLRILSKRNHAILLGILLISYTIFGTFLRSSIFTESAWYFILYLVAAYIKKYPPKWTSRFKTSILGLLICIALAWLSVIALIFAHIRFGIQQDFYMVADSHKLLAFLVGLFAFLTFKNMKPRTNRFINAVASTTFGVLCIHTSSDAMRTMLWKDIVNVPGAYYMTTGKLILYSIGVVLAIFIICSAIDYLRLRFLEKPIFRAINKKTATWSTEDKNIFKRVLSMYNQIEQS